MFAVALDTRAIYRSLSALFAMGMTAVETGCPSHLLRADYEGPR